jgi:hypothetical protein
MKGKRVDLNKRKLASMDTSVLLDARQNRQDKPIDMLHRVDNVTLDRSQE